MKVVYSCNDSQTIKYYAIAVTLRVPNRPLGTQASSLLGFVSQFAGPVRSLICRAASER
jgi:hypothetical protein